MIYRLLFIALLISVLPSCTHEFSLNEVDAERKIVSFLILSCPKICIQDSPKAIRKTTTDFIT